MVEPNENIKVRDYTNVKEKAKQLGCNVPQGISLLPGNFEEANSREELINEGSIDTVRKLWKQNNVPESPIEKQNERYPQIAQYAFGWIGPTIFVSASLISQNPYLITIALGVISNYLTDWFRGIPHSNREAKLSIVVETESGSYKRISYKGHPDGLKELPEIIEKVHHE